MPERALVTGAAQGIGRAVVDRLASQGFEVLALDADGRRLEASGAAWRRDGMAVETHAIDCRDRSALAALLGQGKGLDVLVNNAGVGGALEPIPEVDRASCARVMGINLVGAFKVAQEAVRRMGPGGRVVNVASRGYLGGAGAAHYVASKAGVVALTRAMAVELRWRQIRVNAVAPGMVSTRLIDGFGEAMLGALKRLEPTGDAATPDEIAGLVAFLVGPDAGLVNGQVLLADGGKSLGVPPL